MKVFDSLKKKVEEPKKVVVFPGGNDGRIIKAAVRLAEEGIVEPLLLGRPDEVIKSTGRLNIDLGSVEIINPAVYLSFEEMCQDFVELREGKNILAEIKGILQDAPYFGTMLIYEGKADGMVSGTTHSTTNTVRPALQIIKTRKGMSCVSSAMIVEHKDEKYIFADYAINIDPDSGTLAEIVYRSSKTAGTVGLNPRIAILSFSTRESAKGPMVTKVQDAADLVHQKYPDLVCDDELQFDAAAVPRVGEVKAPGSAAAGHASVFIFPELRPGDISCKVAERLGGFDAIEPVLQGLATPVNDLLRGCRAEDIYLLAILTTAQASMER